MAAAASAAPTAIRVICQPGMPPATMVRTWTGTGIWAGAAGAYAPSGSGLAVQIGDLGLCQLLVDGRVHRGLLGGMAGLCTEDVAKASWCGSGDRAGSGPGSP